MKWFLLLMTVFSFSTSFAEGLPLPLPDEPGQSPSEPGPYPSPQPSPEPAPTPTPTPTPKPRPPSGPYSYTVGFGDTGRFKEREFTFYPMSDWNRIKHVNIIGVSNSIKIKSVAIRYGQNLEWILIPNFAGDLQPGGNLQAWLQGRPIYAISVVAQNKRIWKKPGSFRIDVTGE
ncbi:MAG: hypothetical protein ACKOX6_17875 [Bdellovibrio sp.]